MQGAESLLLEIERFCRSSGMAESTFGRLAVNDGKRCMRLRSGKDVTLETANKIKNFITENQPPAVGAVQPERAARGEDEDLAMSGKTSTRRKVATRGPAKRNGEAG